jgi:hypothetical protein
MLLMTVIGIRSESCRSPWRHGLAAPICALLASNLLQASPVAVRYTEGAVHGFLALRTLEGQTIADGDLIQAAQGDRVTSRLVFHFRDGSLHDDTVIFTQRRSFRLVTDHLIQKGPAFQLAMETWIDAAKGDVKVRYADKGGLEKVEAEHLDLPPDVANGLLLTLLKNIAPDAAETTVSLVAATPKPRLVKLVIAPAGKTPVSVGDSARNAVQFVIKVDIGGISGVIAPLLGKQPPDSHVWVLEEGVPAFVKLEAPLFMGGPLWRVELVSPAWPPPVSPRAP